MKAFPALLSIPLLLCGCGDDQLAAENDSLKLEAAQLRRKVANLEGILADQKVKIQTLEAFAETDAVMDRIRHKLDQAGDLSRQLEQLKAERGHARP